MITRSTADIILAGMDQRAVAPAKSFYKLMNVSYRGDLAAVDTAWGWESLRPWTAARQWKDSEFSDIYSAFSWTTSTSRTEYIIQEGSAVSPYSTSNCLYYQYANGDSVILDKNRTAPGYTDAGTQYIPYGRLLIMMNGVDKMIKFWGDSLVSPFGFTSQPPTPQIAGVDPTRLVPDSSSAVLSDSNWELTNNGVGIALFPHIYAQNNEQEWIVEGTVHYKLPSNEVITTGYLQGHPKDSSYWGIGNTEAGKRSTYSYKVAWVTDTGSESPSSDSVTVTWVTPDKYDPTGPNKDHINPFAIKLGVEITHVPTGPDHVVARRIYRTKNKEDGLTGAGDEYFLVVEIRDNLCTRYVDFIPDSELVTREPGISSAWIIPGALRYGTVWDGRLWLGGGTGSETSVLWSQQGRPEQFGGFDFFDVGVREGGSITALHVIERGLYVFREHAIDVIVKGANGEYKIGTISSSIGTTATSTISSVPGVGTFFLSYDGVYVIKTEDGSIEKISQGIQTYFDRMTRSALPRASAAFSRKWGEYWVHFPSDGETIANIGAVFHVGLGGWSIRGSTSSTDTDYWRFNRIFTDFYGDILIAPSPYVVTGASAGTGNVGLQIVSRCNKAGIFLSDALKTDYEGYAKWSGYSSSSISSTIRSGWARFDKQKGSTVSTHLQVYPTQITPTSFSWLWDGRQRTSTDWTSTAALTSPDEWNSSDADPVWDSTTGLSYSVLSTYDESIMTNNRLVTARFDMQTAAKDSVAWSFSGEDRIILHSWDIRFTSSSRTALRSDA